MVGVGRRCLPKAELIEEAATCLRLLSGRSHRVYTGLALVTPKGHIRQRLVETRVRFKRLSREDIESYLASGEWRGKAGGYAVQGLAGGFVVKLVGSYSNVVGLPLYETMALLPAEGYPGPFQLAEPGLRRRWRARRDRRATRSCRSGPPRACPICGKPSVRATYPFCSKRCADIDLNRWLSGAYAIPAAVGEDASEESGEDGERN